MGWAGTHLEHPQVQALRQNRHRSQPVSVVVCPLTPRPAGPSLVTNWPFRSRRPCPQIVPLCLRRRGVGVMGEPVAEGLAHLGSQATEPWGGLGWRSQTRGLCGLCGLMCAPSRRE